jgi:hypothetical protein
MKLFIRVNYEHSSYEDFFEAAEFPLVFGRDPHCKLRIMGKEIAREHGQIYVEDNQVFLRTNDQKIMKPLQEGTRLRIGRAILTFSYNCFPIDIDHLEVVSSSRVSSGFDKWIHLKAIGVLYLLLIFGNFLLAPNHFRTGDAFKEFLKFMLINLVAVPFSGFLTILVIRKFNRGEYSWKRSVFFTLLFSLITLFVPYVEKLFCWFKGFHVIWQFGFSSFLIPTMVLFLWFNAVGKDRAQRSRLMRALVIVVIFISLSFSAYFLSTDYVSDFQIESCSSLTGWHWGRGESLSQWQLWLEKAKFE